MEYCDYQNVQNILRVLAEAWECPVQAVKEVIQKLIDESWEAAILIPEKRRVWDQHFPDGKPTAEQYILWLGKAHERGEEVPYLLGEADSEG